MTSIYQQVLGSDFERLHPQIQRRFGFGAGDGIASVGRGVMEEVWHGRPWTLPFLRLGAWRSIMFPETGHDVAFTIENHAFIDPFGRETVSWVRTFTTDRGRPRRFDAYMIHSPERARIVDYLGTHEHLAVDLDLSVDSEGGLRIRSGAQRFHEGPVSCRFPLLLSGIAEVREWYDEREARFRIDVAVRNRAWGPLFGYRGAFDVEWLTVTPGATPKHLLPRRYERRD